VTVSLAEYVFVDTAVGGVNHRNHVQRVDEFRINGTPDCYASYQRATDDLVTWVATHRNKNGNPTVAGFDKPTWAPFWPGDLDNEADPGVALGWARRIIQRLDQWGVPRGAARFYFSGAKGFSVEIPSSLFGGFEPSVHLPRFFKQAAGLILREIPYDSAVYDRLRLWRIPNSQHGKTGLFKVQLSADEVLTLTIDEIRALASKPRDPATIPGLTPRVDDQWPAVRALVDLWREAQEAPAGTESRAPGAITDEARDRQTSGAIAASWPHGGQKVAGQSRHADYLMPILGFLARRTVAEHAAALAKEGARQANDSSFLLGRDWENEIDRLAESSASKDQVYGLPTLAEQFPALAAVLAALWPGPAFETLDADPLPTLPEAAWPAPLAEDAFYGLAGRIVRAIAPYTEADEAALFAHLFTGASALVGPHVRAIAGDAPHPARLNAVCVGETSKGRKGSASRPIERLLKRVDDTFGERIMEGLSSGEGLIWQVHDPIYRSERVGKGADRTTELVEVDPGVADKRLWVIESEFASTLRVIQRDGNTLSAIVRRAWDTGDLKTLTKNSPAVATDAHVNITGHVTKDELLRYLDRTELASGFANRFTWLAVRRARLLPEGGEVPEEVLRPLAAEMAGVVEWARTPRLLTRDAEARELWNGVYERLSDGQPGLYGAATNRSEAQTLRLSVFYAILDCSSVIRAEHVLAALAVWQYCEASARWIFGDATGDPIADSILGALRRGGAMRRVDLVNLFDRNVNRARLDRALALLFAAGLVGRRMDTETGGRPAEVWYAR
jgi:hypothetical protein